MFIYLTYKYRIYPKEYQAKKIDYTISAVSGIYNAALDDMIRQYEYTGEILAPQLSDYIHEPHYSFKNVDHLALSHSLNILHRDFLKALKLKAYPRHKVRKGKQSYFTPVRHTDFMVTESFVSLPCVGDVPIVLHRALPSQPINATVIREPCGDYYIAFLICKYLPKADFAQAVSENCIALDYSNPLFYVDSDGYSPNHPRFYKEEEKRLAKEIAKLSRKQKGSSNYYKQLRKVNKLHAKIANRRKDWLHKESKRLADAYEYVGVEDLDLQAIIGTYNLGANAHDNAYGMFIKMLDYKLAAQGKILHKVNRWIRSSQTCNICGYVNRKLRLSDRFWKCPQCHNTVSRDHNAAINIKEQIIKHRG